MTSSRVLRLVNWHGIGLIVVLLLLWQLIVKAWFPNYDSLPAPTAVASAFGGLIPTHAFLSNTGHTLYIMLYGWLVGSAIGALIGLTFGVSATVRRLGLATADVFRAAPGIAFLPLMVLLFGVSSETEIVMVAYVSVWPVLISTMEGAQAPSDTHRDVARVLHLSRLENLLKITLPTSLPYVATGVKLSLSTALALAVVAEMVANPAGLGYWIVERSQALRFGEMFAVIVWVGIIGVLLNYLYDRLTLCISAVRADRMGR